MSWGALGDAMTTGYGVFVNDQEQKRRREELLARQGFERDMEEKRSQSAIALADKTYQRSLDLERQRAQHVERLDERRRRDDTARALAETVDPGAMDATDPTAAFLRQQPSTSALIQPSETLPSRQSVDVMGDTGRPPFRLTSAPASMAMPRFQLSPAQPDAEHVQKLPTASQRALQATRVRQQAVEEGLPTPILKRLYRLHLAGVPNVRPADVETPDERVASQATADARTVRMAQLTAAAHTRGAASGKPAPVPPVDDPTLPNPVKEYLAQLVSQHQSLVGASAELRRAAGSLVRNHPRLDITKVGRALEAFYAKPRDFDELLESAGVNAPSAPSTTGAVAGSSRVGRFIIEPE